MKTYIELKKQREFGEILADTFAFIRNEFRPFLGAIAKIAGPYIALFIIGLIFYIYIIGDQFNFDFINSTEIYSDPLKMILAYIVYIVTATLAYVFTTSTALHYIKSYVDHKGNPNIDEVKQNVNNTFWGFLGLSILKGLTVGFAAVLCCIPVFYVIVPMSVVFPIMVYKNMNATDAYSYSYSLIKDEFWITLATVIVLIIIMYVLSMVFAIPTVIYTWAKMGVFGNEIDPGNLDTLVDPVYIALNVLSSFIQYALNLIVVIGSAFIYFNLNERKNFSGTLERIESLGKIEH
ncbi:hypothetical protein [uncultured Psychroserpens sp.]|uniref:hypothetical protein n=1 Tax=uncultured Psychroserpens sp. TaxID=255436 RepID=UPI0026083E91|nr:hypothetical protein [uncultured Psychroserpens sp.]